MSTIWEQIERLKFEIRIAARDRRNTELACYLERLKEVESEANLTDELRCDSTCLEPGTTNLIRCTYSLGHKTKGRRTKHIHAGFSFQWTDEGAQRYMEELAKKERQETDKLFAASRSTNQPNTRIAPVHVVKPEPALIVNPSKDKRTLKQQHGDAQEAEIYERLLTVYPHTVRTNINAMGVDIQCKPDLDIQSKAFHCVGPKDVSHFADSSDAIFKMLVATSFSKKAKIRAIKRNVTLLTMKEFRERYPLPTEVNNETN